MKYIEVKIFTSKQGLEPLAAALALRGLTEFAVEDPAELACLMDKKNPYDWDDIGADALAEAEKETNITLYAEDTPEGRTVVQVISEAVAVIKEQVRSGWFGAGVSFGRLAVESRIADEADWRDSWKAYCKPFALTGRITVKPTWEMYECKPEELVIEIDPGMAFGTGSHPTTMLCARMLERLAGRFRTFFDVGCGSGILSIAAALLGAKTVLGLDLDPVAVTVARENVERNGVADRVRIEKGNLLNGITGKADVIAANLSADLVRRLSKDAASYLNDEGVLIVSGILTEQWRDVKPVIESAGFEIVNVFEKEEWRAALARRR